MERKKSQQLRIDTDVDDQIQLKPKLSLNAAMLNSLPQGGPPQMQLSPRGLPGQT